MQQVVLNSLIGAHRQLELTLGARQAAGSLDDLVPECVESFKSPQGRSLLSRFSPWLVGDHMQLTVQVMRKDCSQYVDAIAGLSSSWHIIHLDLGFQFSKQPFLSATAMVEADDLCSFDRLVGDDDAVIVVRV